MMATDENKLTAGARGPLTATNWPGESKLKGLEGALQFTRELVVKAKDAVTSDEVKAKARKMIVKTIEQQSVKQGKKIIKGLPFGEAILVSIELSKAFAEGVGEALKEVNEKLAVDYDRPIRDSDGLSQADIEVIQNMRRYQLRACQELNGILTRGVQSAGRSAMSQIKDWAGSAVSGMVEDVCGQLADDLIRQNDLVAIFSDVTEAAAKGIPEGHKRVLGTAFNFASTTLVTQMGGAEMKERCGPILAAAGSNEPIGTAMLKGIVQVLVEGSWREYARRVPVVAAEGAIEGMICEQGNAILKNFLPDYKLTQGDGQEVVVTGNNIEIPREVYGQIIRGSTVTVEEMRRYHDRLDTVVAHRDGLIAMLKAKQIKYQWQINHLRKYDVAVVAQAGVDNYTKLLSGFVDEQKAAYTEVEQMIQSVANEFPASGDASSLRYILAQMPQAGAGYPPILSLREK